jgi:NAD(P)-dependent dehydrogenase (short-subunit alcohol dehydrogenase family)
MMAVFIKVCSDGLVQAGQGLRISREMASETDIISAGGRVVMVSGASRGIGAAIVRRLLDDGYRMSIGVRDPDAARESFTGYNEDHLSVNRFDALDSETAAAWVAATVAHFGRIDALINNAGIWHQVNFETEDEGMLDEMWDVNVKGPFRLTRLALPHLRAVGNGRIVNIASTDGLRFRDETCSVGYTMTKHALVAMSHAARFAGWEDGVRVTALCPGAVATELVASVPGVTPLAERLAPETVAHLVSMILGLPNTAVVAELPVNTRLESTV